MSIYRCINIYRIYIYIYCNVINMSVFINQCIKNMIGMKRVNTYMYEGFCKYYVGYVSYSISSRNTRRSIQFPPFFFIQAQGC